MKLNRILFPNMNISLNAHAEMEIIFKVLNDENENNYTCEGNNGLVGVQCVYHVYCTFHFQYIWTIYRSIHSQER